MAKCNILPVFIPHGGCPHHCVFCNQHIITGEVGLPSLKNLDDMLRNDLPINTELAYYGGSFTALPEEIRLRYLKYAWEHKESAVINKIRISTHPAYINAAVIEELKHYSVDTVELGIQSTDDGVLALSERGHGKQEIDKALYLLKEAGFTVGVQLMVGLPGSDKQKELQSVLDVLPYHPDIARIYPVLVLKGTTLAEWYLNKKYTPLTIEQAVDISCDMLVLLEEQNVSVIRMGLQPTDDISPQGTEYLAGPFHDAFGHLVRCRKKRFQMEMLIEDTGATREIVFVAPEADIPLLAGDHKDNRCYFRDRGYDASIGVLDLPRGDIGIRDYNGSVEILTENSFLSRRASFVRNSITQL